MSGRMLQGKDFPLDGRESHMRRRFLCSFPSVPILDTVVSGCDARSCGSHLATTRGQA